MTKNDVYRIPVFANIMQATQFEEVEKESWALHNRPAKKGNVREASAPVSRRQRRQVVGLTVQPSTTGPTPEPGQQKPGRNCFLLTFVRLGRNNWF